MYVSNRNLVSTPKSYSEIKKILFEPRRAGCNSHITEQVWLWPSFCVVTTSARLGYGIFLPYTLGLADPVFVVKRAGEVPKGWFLGSLKAH